MKNATILNNIQNAIGTTPLSQKYLTKVSKVSVLTTVGTNKFSDRRSNSLADIQERVIPLKQLSISDKKEIK